MSSPDIIRLADIDVKHITFSEVKNLDKGKMVYINYKSKPLYYVTPTLYSPFGLSSWEDASVEDKNKKYSIQLSIGNNPEEQILINKIKEIEDHVIEAALANSWAWLKKKPESTSKNVISELFSSSISYPKNSDGEITDKYPPTVKYQIAADCEAYLSKDNPIEISKETIPKSSKICVINRCFAIWFVGCKFGIVNKALQLKVCLPSTVGKPKFIEDPDDEDV